MLKRRLGRRVACEHGLISNVLPGLTLVDQLSISNICSRTYFVTVPWNMPAVKMPHDFTSNFPEIDLISEDFVCKRQSAQIEGESGFFYGSICKLKNLPEGCGVFVTDEWVHCGAVKDGLFSDGRRVSAKKGAKVLKLVN